MFSNLLIAIVVVVATAVVWVFIAFRGTEKGCVTSEVIGGTIGAALFVSVVGALTGYLCGANAIGTIEGLYGALGISVLCLALSFAP